MLKKNDFQMELSKYFLLCVHSFLSTENIRMIAQAVKRIEQKLPLIF